MLIWLHLSNMYKEHPLNYGDVDVDSLLEMFYWCYCEINPMETDKIKALFREGQWVIEMRQK